MNPPETMLLQSLVLGGLFLLAAFAGSRWLASKKIGHLLAPWGWQDWHIGVVQGLKIFVAVTILGSASLLLYPVPDHPLQTMINSTVDDTSSDGCRIFLYFLAGTVVAPFTEEVFFRGLILPALAWRFGNRMGLLASSVLFGAIHGDIYRFLPLAVAGWLLGKVVLEKRTVGAAIVAHGVWNLCGLLLMMSLAIG